MVPLFLLAVAVQWNDPDPVRWMAIYGAAFAVALVVALRGRIDMTMPILVGLVALLWSLMTLTGVPAASYRHMFDAWEMRSEPIEAAREATGLLIVAAWMFVVAGGQRRRSGGRP
jgi:hypothetical protein